MSTQAKNRYAEFVKKHSDVLDRYFQVLIDCAEEEGIARTANPNVDIETWFAMNKIIANVIGSENHKGCRELSGYIQNVIAGRKRPSV